VLDDGYKDGAEELVGDHKPAGPFRGWKTDYYEGGTRIPFIVSWKSHIKPGISNALVCQTDFLPSFAAFLNQDCIPVDGQNIMKALLGKSKKGRKNLILEGYRRKVSFRENEWAFIPAYGKRDAELYNLKNDIAQKHNLAKQNPKQLEKLKAKYEAMSANCLSED
jgi:arylsulfatase A-like enzyme